MPVNIVLLFLLPCLTVAFIPSSGIKGLPGTYNPVQEPVKSGKHPLAGIANPIVPAHDRSGVATYATAVAEAVTAFPNLITNPKFPKSVKPGVVTGQALMDLLKYAKDNKFAIPAVNVVSSSSINACLEAAKEYKSPIIIQFSRGGGQFLSGQGCGIDADTAGTKGCLASALHVRTVAEMYGVPVILHTDHCMKGWLPWFDGLLEENEKYFAAHGEPLFSSHMLDLSELPLKENLDLCEKYLTRMSKINLLLEMELGVTGGEEDGVDNSGVDNSELYTKPEEVWETYEKLSKVPNGMFTIAAAFGNVHGVYAGDIALKPSILHESQKYAAERIGDGDKKPLYFVFHGGSGSSIDDIKYAIDAGVIKMNIDTDTQWSYWDGIRKYEAKNRDYLQSQIGNPDGPEKTNKAYYDPRKALREGEKTTVERLGQAMEDLNSKGVL